VAVRHGHLRAELEQLPRRGLADAVAGRACDEGDPAGELPALGTHARTTFVASLACSSLRATL
jgi:hypothetical protein